MTSSSASSTSKRKFNPLVWVLGLSAAFFLFFMLVTGIFYLAKSPGRKSAGARAGAGLFSAGSVGVVELNGAIMDSKKTLQRLEEFEEDASVKAVVLRLNSPGGAVGPSQEIYEAVKKFPKPIVASMGSVAASGAYYIACGAKKVYANAGTLTGSIGVIMDFINLEKLYEWAKIKRYSLKTGKFKAAGAEYREMTEEEKQLFQAMIEDVLGQFKSAVSEGRKLSMAEVDRVADGRIMSGSQAKQAKLVDELGTLRDAVQEAANMAGLKGKPNVVYPMKSGRKWLELIMDETQRGEDSDASLSFAALVLRALFQPLSQGGADATSSTGFGSGLQPGIYWMWKGAI